MLYHLHVVCKTMTNARNILTLTHIERVELYSEQTKQNFAFDTEVRLASLLEKGKEIN